jgi:hypothetical protein
MLIMNLPIVDCPFVIVRAVCCYFIKCICSFIVIAQAATLFVSRIIHERILRVCGRNNAQVSFFKFFVFFLQYLAWLVNPLGSQVIEGKVPLEPVFSERVAEVRDSPNSYELNEKLFTSS